jgi:hypothetical protein
MKPQSNFKWLITLSILVCFAYNLKSQTNFIFGKQMGSEKDGKSYNVVTDNIGNAYIAGKTEGVLGSQNFGKFDGFISKFDSLGNVIWTKQFGTNDDDKFSWLAIDNFNNLYITGQTKGLFANKKFGNDDIIVLRLDTAGNVIWQKQFGSDSTDISNIIFADNIGNIYISGKTKGLMGKSSFGKTDGILLKLDNNGNLLWSSQFGTLQDDESISITSDMNSDLILSGYTGGDLSAKNKGSIDAFLVKFNNKGEQLKMLQFGTDSFDVATHIIVDKFNNIYVGGSTGGDLGGKPQGNGDAFLSKFNANWEIQWTQHFGTSKWDGVNGIALFDQTGEKIVISGCQNWPSCQSFVRMYKNDGNLLWVNNFTASGKNGGTCGTGVGVDKKGNIYHTGNTGASLFKNINKPDGHDIFLIKLNSTTSN